MLEILKEQVYEANMELPRRGLTIYTWGNISRIDRASGLLVVKPSGVDYDDLRPEDMVVMDLKGSRVEGTMNPSSDTATHLKLCRAFPKIGGVVHIHSPFVTSWAQAGRGISCYGTTHADHFHEETPCTRNLTPEETRESYEKNTGKVIAETSARKNPVYVPGALCKNHGPFTWGKDATQAVHNAVVLGGIAKMNLMTELPNPNGDNQTPQCIQDKHFLRKRSPNAYYGQGKE